MSGSKINFSIIEIVILCLKPAKSCHGTARTTADFTGPEDYVFHADGGFSWVAPYLAGSYALRVQVKPDITPEKFWITAMQIASEQTFYIHNAQTVANAQKPEASKFWHVTDPVALMEALKER